MARAEWKPPKKIEDGGLTWTVLVVDQIPTEDGKPDHATLGLTDGERLTIYIKRGLPPQRMRQTFLHELVHVILTGLGHDEQNEELVDGIAHALHRLTRDNPGLMR